MSGNTPRRTVRIEDGLWVAAKEKAEDRGDILSDIIREALRNYTESDDE